MRSASSVFVIIPGFGEPNWDYKISILQNNCLKLVRNFHPKNILITLCQYTHDREIPMEMIREFNLHVIKEKGLPGNFIKRHATPEHVSGHSHVMILLDDVEIKDNFSFPCIEDFMNDLNIDLVSPSHTADSKFEFGEYDPPSTNNDESHCTLVNLCELFLYIFKTSAYHTYYQYVSHDNPWMWGMESLLHHKMGLTVGILNKVTITHYHKASSPQSQAWQDRHRYLEKLEETHLGVLRVVKNVVNYKITKIKKSMRTLVLYVFHEFNDCVEFFIKNALFHDKDTDFLLICNNEHLDIKSKVCVPSYVRVLQRPNQGFDFGGWSDGLLRDDCYKAYECFLFINSSAIGPLRSLKNISDFYDLWTQPFINGLDKEIALFGSTINTTYWKRTDIPWEEHPLHFSHVQSYVFAMKRETLDLLIQKGIFSTKEYLTDFGETIEKKEIGMSRIVLDNGKNIGCLMRCYQGIDFRFQHKKPADYGKGFFMGDVMFPEFVDKFIFPNELIFVKGNRLSDIPKP